MSSARSWFPIPLNTRRYVRAWNFIQAVSKSVHHANIKIDQTRLSASGMKREPGPGYDGGGSREAMFPDGHFLGWTPGQSPRVSPPGMAWRLDPGSDLVIEMHLMPTGNDRAGAGERRPVLHRRAADEDAPTCCGIGRQDIDIRRRTARTTSTPTPTRCRSMSRCSPCSRTRTIWPARCDGFATLPDGTTRAADLHQGLGLPLAGRVSATHAVRAAQGHA